MGRFVRKSSQQFQQMSTDKGPEKTVQQKIKECKELVIQNMEKTLQHKMVYMFLKDRKRQPDVKTFTVNSKDGVIKIEFVDHDKAYAFYRDANFSQKILVRPFNIYFNLALSDDEMKKYYLQGINEENQRQLFEAANRIGVCKLYTNYGSGSRAKLKSTGLLSFIRKDAIPEAEFKKLEDQLKGLNIKIFNYVHDKGVKVSLNLVNYLSDDLYNTDDNAILQLAENEAKKILEKHVKQPKIHHLSVVYRKKEVENKQTQTKTNKLLTSALFEFENSEVTYDIYEKMRIGIRDDALGKVKVFFHNEENNSFLSLITQGLNKPENSTEKQFEEVLIENFQKINKNVIQVNIFPVPYNKTYVGRVYLKSEEDGKDFIGNYSFSRSKLYEFYKERSNIIFDISVDTKTLRKIKNAEKKAKETEDKIKKQTEANRRENRRPNNGPLPPMGGGFGPMMPLGSNMPPMPNMPNMPPMGNMMMNAPQGNMGMMGGMGGRMGDNMGMPFKGMPGPVPSPMGPMHQGSRGKIGQLIRDKDRILSMEENQAKRVLSESLKILAEEQGVSGSESTRLVNTLIKDLRTHEVFRFLEEPQQFKDSLNRLKQNQN